jgi:uncharacterized protein YbjT (DUF2867 family)
MIMKILLTGATGYIGSRLLELLLEQGHEVVAIARFQSPFLLVEHANLTVILMDLLEENSSQELPSDIDVAYYLVHAMSYGKTQFAQFEEKSIHNFVNLVRKARVKQIIYLSGLCNDKNLSPHLMSRYKTECYIRDSQIPYTILRAGIIIGSGSASFEIIRDLVDKLPVMVAPRWINNLCQPIGVQDVLRYLIAVVKHPECLNQVFDIGGPDRLNYKEMLLIYYKERKLKRYIFALPVLTPRLSSYWLYFVTSVNFSLAYALVDSVKNETVCQESRILKIFPQPCLKYQKCLEQALDVVEQNPLLPGWRDSLVSGILESKLAKLVKVPTHGCLVDRRTVETTASPQDVIDQLWSIGGKRGWYYMDWAWELRGFIDKLLGGAGLNRGRTYPHDIFAGSSLDFWRVLLADKEKGHLLLYAEMKVPGEAWLEFIVEPTSEGSHLIQTASFRPKGVLGRLYWYTLLPIHKLIFRGMARAIAHPKPSQ